MERCTILATPDPFPPLATGPAGIYISDSQRQPAFTGSADRPAPGTDHQGLSFGVNKSKKSRGQHRIAPGPASAQLQRSR